MALLSIDDIKSADDKKTVDVPCPEWGGDVRMRSLTGDERDSIDVWSMNRKRGSGLRKKLIEMCCINEDGSPLFVDADAIAALMQKSAAPVERLFSESLKLAGMSDRDVEGLEKNLDEAPDSDSD